MADWVVCHTVLTSNTTSRAGTNSPCSLSTGDRSLDSAYSQIDYYKKHNYDNASQALYAVLTVLLPDDPRGPNAGGPTVH